MADLHTVEGVGILRRIGGSCVDLTETRDTFVFHAFLRGLPLTVILWCMLNKL